MSIHVTASMLYDLLQCPYRVKLDSSSDLGRRDKVNPFVQMLWEKGSQYENEVMSGLEQDYLDLSVFALEEKEQKTAQAMAEGCLLYTSPSPRDATLSRMPSSA